MDLCCDFHQRGKGYRAPRAAEQTCQPQAKGRPNFQVRWRECRFGDTGGTPVVCDPIEVEAFAGVILDCILNPSPILLAITSGLPFSVSITLNETYAGSGDPMIVSAAVIASNLVVALADPTDALDNGTYDAVLTLTNCSDSVEFPIQVTVNCAGGGS